MCRQLSLDHVMYEIKADIHFCSKDIKLTDGIILFLPC